MSLAVIVDALVTRISSGLGAGTRVDDLLPTAAAELPSVTVSLDEVTQQVAGVGRIPRGTRSGALLLTLDVDLAHPSIDLGGGETLLLVPADRRSLVLPHGPLVRADGTDDGAFAAGDLLVRDGTGPWTVVGATPTARQVRPDVDAGMLRFGTALGATGVLHVEYRIGRWDVVVSRHQGLAELSVAADAAALPALVRRVATEVARPHPSMRLTPCGWGSGGKAPSGDVPAKTRVQLLRYHFDAEIEQPLLGAGGGVIRDVEATARTQATGTNPAESPTETFHIV
jgi:hypothetical protein